ncbi:MAG: lamin tail domain-containing protein, partial [Chthoniobacteraceae bacterium]
ARGGPPDPNGGAQLRFNEIASASDPNFFIELRNTSSVPLNTTGWSISASSGQTVALSAQTIPAGGFLALDAAALGFAPTDGTRLHLLAPGGAELQDSRAVTNRLRGRTEAGNWGFPSSATPGGANVVTVTDAIVINEIFYHGLDGSPEQWVELHNKSAASVDLEGWKFSDGISFDFPAGATIAAGGFIVVAWDPAAFAALHPGVTALGPFGGSLSGKGETMTLSDANGNAADQVTYADGGRWSEFADGGGSSLELRDPRADNAKGEAWDASDESAASTWENVSYSGPGTNANSPDPTNYNEFVFGLLDSGEFLIDDISVKDMGTIAVPTNIELIQNGAFGGGTATAWRIIGTHAGTVVDDPTSPGNPVLKISASGPTEHMNNHAETTLKQGASFHVINPSHTYAVSFRAKWLRGSNRLHARLWHNRLARQTQLNRPATGGTPGAANGRKVANIGPTFDALAHAPVVPPAGEPATVSIQVADPDGIGGVEIFSSVNGAAFTSSAMSTTSDGVYSATIPGQSAGALVQFYIRATDSLGAVSFFPAAGPDSRAMIPWQDGRARLTLPTGAKPHNIRIVLPKADTTEMFKPENLMSDGAIPCTVILDEHEVYYRVGVRLKSSEHGRISEQRCGFTLEFPADQLFLGTHDTISIDRSGGVVAGQLEILLKRLENTAGGIIASEDDIVRVISPVGASMPGQFTGANMTGPAILSKTRLDKAFLDAQWPHGGDGSQHKYERVYVLTQTINPATRVVDPTIVPEHPKIPQDTTGPPGVGFNSLGANKENYRWYWLLQNAREADDYTGMIQVANAIGQPGGSAGFRTLVEQSVDVDAWLRATIPATLFGVIDNYLGSGGGQHNALIQILPGRKAVLIPWDLDFLNQTTASSSLTAGGDVGKFISNPVWKRLFYGHLLDILNRSFNTAYMSRWAAHYSRFGTDNMTGAVSSYLTPRAAFARSQVNAQIPPVAFARTSDSPVTVSTPFATVSGVGWVDIADIRLDGSLKPLAVTWTGQTSWELQLPVSPGTNTYTLVASGTDGAELGTTTVTITGDGTVFPAGPGNLAVSELNYNPPGAGDTTEFIELLNLTGATLDLTGCHFDEESGQGIDFTFAEGEQIAAGARIIIARDRAAFLALYPGAASNLATGEYNPSALDNGGEMIVLYAASGLEIFRFRYDDRIASTDGDGRSLVRILASTNPDPSTYDWRASTTDGGNPGTSDAVPFTGDALADIDEDGLKMFVEYALGSSDTSPTPPPGELSQDAQGRWLFTFSRAASADDVALTIESAATLGDTWMPANAMLISSVPLGNNVVETWRVIPPGNATTFFTRLKATLR